MHSHDDPSADAERASSGALLVALRGAEAQASTDFERLYASAVPALVAWTRLRIAGLARGRIEVEDIVQETWARALQNIERLSDHAGFRFWVIGIAQNVLLESLRRDARGRNRDLHPQQDGSPSQCPDSVTSISRAAARDDGLARLLALILELPLEDRLLVLLHGLEERPLARVAEQLEISEAAAEKRWQRLCSRLREQPAFAALLVG